ncbi:MAG: FAD-dependent oxidoreductase [Pseudomonadota bacterium]
MSDFLVIGGGIAGLSVGARLAALGKVTLLEAEPDLGYHASGRSAAMFEESYGAAPVRALNRASRADLEARDVLSPRGLMLVGGAGEKAAFEDDATAMHMERITSAEARATLPILDTDATPYTAFHSDAWDIDTDKLLQSFRRDLLKNGEIVTRARVEALSRVGDIWEAQCPIGTYAAPIVVNAAGAWADRVGALAGIAPIGLQPYRRSMARVPAPDGHDVAAWPMVFGAGETWYAKPDAGALLISPADEDPIDPMDAWADDMVLAEGIARYQHHMTHPVTRMISNWAGLRTFAPDRALVIGFAAAHKGFFWLAGQGGYGFQTSAAASQLAADLIAGRQPVLPHDIVAALSPDRFA